MALIKSQQATDLAHDAIVLDLGDLRRQGSAIIAQAQSQANSILAEARAHAAELTKSATSAGQADGFAKGYEEGKAAGSDAGHAEALAASTESVGVLEQAWIAAAQKWDADRRQMLTEAKSTLVEVAVRLAERVARRVPTVDPTVVVDQVAEAIDYAARPCDVTVRINPADRALVEQAMPKLIETLPNVEHVTLTDDDTITAGGCDVTFGSGRIDATLDTQLARIAQALLPDRHKTEPQTPTETS